VQAQTNQRSSCKINHEELMVSDSKSDWHHACICHCQVAGGPDAVNGFAPLEIRSLELFRCKFPHNLLHTKTIQVCQLPPQLSPINIFVGINNRMRRSPSFCHFFIWQRRSSWNRVHGQVSSLSLLIRCWWCCWQTVPESFFYWHRGNFHKSPG
jgi:hypothetical protein